MGLVGKGVKKNPTLAQIWPYLCGILLKKETPSPTSVLYFFAILIVEQIVCNTLELVRVDLLG